MRKLGHRNLAIGGPVTQTQAVGPQSPHLYHYTLPDISLRPDTTVCSSVEQSHCNQKRRQAASQCNQTILRVLLPATTLQAKILSQRFGDKGKESLFKSSYLSLTSSGAIQLSLSQRASPLFILIGSGGISFSANPILDCPQLPQQTPPEDPPYFSPVI